VPAYKLIFAEEIKEPPGTSANIEYSGEIQKVAVLPSTSILLTSADTRDYALTKTALKPKKFASSLNSGK